MRLTPVGKGVLAIAVLGVAAAISWYAYNNYFATDGGVPGRDRPLRVGVVTWPGYAGGIVANNGFKPNQECIYYKNHKIQVEFMLLEDVVTRAELFSKGGADGVDIVWSTVDFWANELPGFVKSGVKARAIMQVDWSRGGDAIVVDDSIKRIEDLKGKKISLALFTPSHWLLEYNLKASSLTEVEQDEIVRGLIGKNASPDAREDFVSRAVDAAVVWEPDVTEALQKRPNSRILVSSKTAAKLIADLMVAREDFIQKHPDIIKAFVQGWLEGTEEANRKPDLVVKLLMENEPVYKDLGPEVTRQGLATVKWADLSDNIEMFGLDGGEALFDRLFRDASLAWTKRGYISQAVPPSEAKDDGFLKQTYLAATVKPPRPADPSLPAPTPDIIQKVAITSAPVDIKFDTGRYELNDSNKKTLDPVALLAQTNSNAYIRVEGNTDSVGNIEANKFLSQRRAQSVVDYFIERYNLNRTRFIVKGNGPNKPVASNDTEEGRAKNRRTDVEVVTK
jgi:NitT/TauT family transport system substrate-binding protein